MTSMGASSWRQRVRKTLDYAAWAYLYRSLSPVQLYELIATDTVARHGLYINMGYWKDAQCMDEACVAMARLLADTVQLGSDDLVLDVGFGFGEQDVYWMEHYGPRRIVGINIAPSQVAAARQRVTTRRMADRVQLHFGSATELPFQSECFTAITALESAFHFVTRERFFHEAYRALQPGGRLVLSDIIPTARPRSRQQRWHYARSWQTFLRTWASPAANAYPATDYADRLRGAGFASVRVQSVRNHVFPGYHAYCTTHPEYLQRFNPVIRLHHRVAGVLGVEAVYGAFDYVIAVATRPPA
jgi:cyclopropane fatty-acyl-phospholipid synthase-like methyltransferase